MKRFEGVLKATAEKRYKHFLWYTADRESVWMLSNGDGFATIDIDGYIHLLVWPSKEFAVAFDSEDNPVEIEIHDFCERCKEMSNEDKIRFMVFPNSEDAYIISAEDLLNDIIYELDLVE